MSPEDKGRFVWPEKGTRVHILAPEHEQFALERTYDRYVRTICGSIYLTPELKQHDPHHRVGLWVIFPMRKNPQDDRPLCQKCAGVFDDQEAA